MKIRRERNIYRERGEEGEWGERRWRENTQREKEREIRKKMERERERERKSERARERSGKGLY